MLFIERSMIGGLFAEDSLSADLFLTPVAKCQHECLSDESTEWKAIFKRGL